MIPRKPRPMRAPVRFKRMPIEAKKFLARLPENVRKYVLNTIDTAPGAIRGVPTSQAMHGFKNKAHVAWRNTAAKAIRESVIMENHAAPGVRSYRVLMPGEFIPEGFIKISTTDLGELFGVDHSTLVIVFKKMERSKHESEETQATG